MGDDDKTERRYSPAKEAIPNPPTITSSSANASANVTRVTGGSSTLSFSSLLSSTTTTTKTLVSTSKSTSLKSQKKNTRRPLPAFHHVSFYHGNKLLFRKPVNNNYNTKSVNNSDNNNNNNINSMGFKLKIGGSTPASTPVSTSASIPPTPAASTPTPGAGPKIRFSFGPKTPAIKDEPLTETAPLPAPNSAVKAKPGRKPKPSAKLLANKKRAKEDSDNDDDENDNGAITIDTSRTTVPKKKLKFSINSAHSAHPPTPKTPLVVKAKFKGKPPKRPLGEGYDSEASDREDDPVIEEEWILRMYPGDDCEYLRTMITERKIGIPKAQGGADVYFKFFQNEGRRAAITIRGKCYAATMVDLPCVIEGMKSWDKKGWYKSADICQMLLVFAPVADEKEAETIELPKIIDPTTFQYPHGLTAPMRNARKNRFRKRIRREAIEAVEDAVEKLLAADAEAYDTRYEMIEPEAMSRHASYSSPARYGQEEEEDEEEYSGDEDMDAEGEVDDEGYFNQGNGSAVPEASDNLFDDIDLEAEFEREMLDNDNIIEDQGSTPAATPLATTTTSSDSKINTITTTAGRAAEESDEESDEDSDASEEDEDDDEDSRARKAELAGAREDIVEMERQLESLQKQLAQQNNPILKSRVRNNIEKVRGELELKRSALGVEDD